MQKKQALHKQAAGFIDTMDCLPVSRLPEGPEWTYEIKLDGYRLEVVQSAGRTTLYSRRRNVLNQKFHYVASALRDLPDETVIDGELVALGPDGRPDFNLLQNFRSAEARIVYYAFDILIHKQRDLTDLPLSERRTILKNLIEPGEHVALSQVSDRSASEIWNLSRATAWRVQSRSVQTASTSLGIDRNPADLVEVNRPDDSRERYLSEDELHRLKIALDEKMFRKGTKDINQTNLRMRLIVLIAVSTGMRSTEIHRLRWSDVMYSEGLLAVRARLKNGKVRYVPMPSEMAEEIRRYPAVIGAGPDFSAEGGTNEPASETGRKF